MKVYIVWNSGAESAGAEVMVNIYATEELAQNAVTAAPPFTDYYVEPHDVVSIGPHHRLFRDGGIAR